ncbi:MAG TPA: GNAT family N-acetyltransferase [Saprospiraceae bacterium]|nr:GNAT family N-acetyltransferase [Saprospiraceae bacterium]
MSTGNFRIENTTPSDLDFIFSLFESAMEYQRKNNYPVWAGYDRNVILEDMERKQQYKIMVEEEIGIVFSVIYADPLIWRERDKGDAIYLHRIVVNPKFKGQKLFGRILDWALTHAQEKQLDYIRMDTWGDNPNMIAYYMSYGFHFIGNHKTSCTTELPQQNRNLVLALLEMNVRR